MKMAGNSLCDDEVSVYLGLLKELNNARLPSPPRSNPITPLSRVGEAEQAALVPFYIHCPDQSAHFKVVRLAYNPSSVCGKLKTPTLLAQKSSLEPLSSSLTITRTHLSDLSQPPECLVSSCADQAVVKTIYDDEARKRDSSQPIGYIRRDKLLERLLDDNKKMVEMNSYPCWKILYRLDSNLHVQAQSCNENVWAVSFENWLNESEDPIELRSQHLDRLARSWKESKYFPDVLEGWRDEEYSIYGPQSVSQPQPNLACRIERAASALFGVLTFGVHLTAYIRKEGEFYVWTPRRSANKPTWPSRLDNTAAGGITSKDLPFESMVREAFEEASIDKDYSRKNIKPLGMISYIHRNSEGWVQPEIQYTYELELPSDGSIKPKPNDGESVNFELLSVGQVKNLLSITTVLSPKGAVNDSRDLASEVGFKPNSAAVLIEFLWRHGLIAHQDIQPSKFIELCWNLNHPIDLPLPFSHSC